MLHLDEAYHTDYGGYNSCLFPKSRYRNIVAETAGLIQAFVADFPCAGKGYCAGGLSCAPVIQPL